MATLSLFWLASGAIGLWQRDAARRCWSGAASPPRSPPIVVVGGALVDLALGLAILCRPWARAACLAMAGTALAYLAGATIVAPQLWADPLGPLLKVLPSIVLGLQTAAILEER